MKKLSCYLALLLGVAAVPLAAQGPDTLRNKPGSAYLSDVRVIRAFTPTRGELIVVDASSTDGTAEIAARYAMALTDERGQILVGNLPQTSAVWRWLPWGDMAMDHEVPVSPVGNGLMLKARGYRTSQDVVGTGFFAVVGALSVLTVWMLLGTWRHTRKRVQAQQALMAETNFRRAMENSMLTGMRALDMQGRITYVNPAFCSMTGWTEAELVGRTAPFPYWPPEDQDMLAARLEDEINGRSTPGGFEVRVQRRDGSVFDARMYVSPLIDPNGHQTGWMTSMTDITEPKRIREELTASYERFTTVLEGLDSAISVAPLGSDEMLFANRVYRMWFGTQGHGHRQMAELSGLQARGQGPGRCSGGARGLHRSRDLRTG